MSTTGPQGDLEYGNPAASTEQLPSPSPTLCRVSSPESERRIRGEVPLELVGAMLEKGDAFVVTFSGADDPRNPQNWPYILHTSSLTPG